MLIMNSKTENAIFICSFNAVIVILVVYVDDIVLIDTDVRGTVGIKKH